jgi:hypothetical protein
LKRYLLEAGIGMRGVAVHFPILVVISWSVFYWMPLFGHVLVDNFCNLFMANCCAHDAEQGRGTRVGCDSSAASRWKLTASWADEVFATHSRPYVRFWGKGAPLKELR